MAELPRDAGQVTHPVAIRVEIGARVNLVNDRAAPPGLRGFGDVDR